MKNRSIWAIFAATSLLGGCGMILGFDEGIERTQYYGKTAGEPLPDIEQVKGDCHKLVYDGVNGYTKSIDDSDAPDDNDLCTKDSCENGVGKHEGCSSGQECVAGACVVVCGSAQVECGGVCIDPQTDEANCGSCGNACGVGASCLAGTCRTCMGTLGLPGRKRESSTTHGLVDVNGDGIVDMVTEGKTKSFAIKIGRGDGTFDAGGEYGTSGISDIDFGDVTGDGKIDIVTVAYNSAWVYVNDGTGDFMQAIDLKAGGYDGTYNVAVAVADLSGDATAEIIISRSNLSMNNVAVLRRESTGAFSSTFATAGTTPRRIAVGRFNKNNTLPDVAIVNSDNTVSIFSNNNGGISAMPIVTLPSSGTNAWGILAHDINGDGNLDLVVSQYRSLAIFRGNGDGTFDTTPTMIQTDVYMYDIAAVDLDHNGKIDLVSNGAGSFYILLQSDQGNLDFQKTRIPNYFASSGLALGDVNQDQKIDVVCGGFVALGDGQGSLLLPDVFDTGKNIVAVGDMGGNGQAPEVLSVADDDKVTTLLNDGSGQFGEPPTSTNAKVSSSSRGLLRDFNGDGKLDLAVKNGTQISVLLRNDNGLGDPTIYVSNTGSSQNSIASGDFNGDGYPDLVVAGSAGIGVFMNNGKDKSGAFEDEVVYATTQQGALFVDVGKVDADEFEDIVIITEASSADIRIYRNNAQGGFWPPKPSEIYSAGVNNVRSMALANLDRLGGVDLVVTTTNSLTVLPYNGGYFPQTKYTISSQSGAFTIGDLDGDGANDIAVAGNEIAIFRNKGNGTFISNYGSYLPRLENPNRIFSADLNGDGKVDLAASNGNAVSVMLNRCLE